MKTHKKNPKKQIEKFSVVFVQLSLVLVLFITYVLMEYAVGEKRIINPSDVEIHYDYFPESVSDYVKEQPKKKVAVVKTQPKLNLTKIIKGDPPKETALVVKLTVPVTSVSHTNNTKGEEPTKKIIPVVENKVYSFSSVTPLFKGCKNRSNQENRDCFDKKMKKFVYKKFDASIGEELGLSSGSYKIYAQFIIDEKGDVVDIKVRAPHQKMKKDVLKMIGKLPKFTPGKFGNKNVKVRYLLPINFQVD
jgi:protein TonB